MIWDGSGDGGGNGQSMCLWVCVLFPGVHPGDRLGKRPLGLPEVWAGAKKSKTKIEGKGRERETSYLRIKHMVLWRNIGFEDSEGVRGRRSIGDEEMVWTKLYMWGAMYGKWKHSHNVSHTHSDWNHMLTQRRSGMLRFPSCAGMESGRDREGGMESTRDCRWSSAMGNSLSAALCGQVRSISSKHGRRLPLCEPTVSVQT